MIRLLLASVLASVLGAQTFDLGADRSDIYLGETLQLRALLRNVDGSAWELPLVYSSENPSIADVSSDGRVTSRKFGSVRLRVSTPQLAGVFGSFVLRVIPYYVKILPESAQIEVGQSYQLEAFAYDFFNQPVPGIAFKWELFNSLSQAYPLASIDDSGLLTALAASPLYVRASLTYEGLSSRPGSFDTWAVIEVSPKKSYTPSILYSDENSFAHGPAALRPAPGFFVSNGQGSLVFTGSLNSYAGAVFEYSGGTLTALASAGVPSPFPGGVVAGFQGASVNRTGQTLIAVNAGENRNDGGILLCAQRTCEYVVLDGFASAGQFAGLAFPRIGSESLNARGAFVFVALFRPPDATARDGLFLYDHGVLTLLWDAAKTLPNQTGPRMQFVLDIVDRTSWSPLTGLSLDDQDNVVFIGQRENQSSGRCLYRFPASAPARIESLFCAGSTLAGLGQIKAFGNLRARPDGAIGLRLDIGNASYLAILKSGKLTTLPLLGNANTRLLSVEGPQVLFYGRAKSSTNQELEGLLRWTWSASSTTIVRVATRLPDHATVNESGITTLVDAPFVVSEIQPTGTSSEILGIGRPAGILQALHVRGLLRAQSAADRVRLLVGEPTALLEIAGNTARAILLLGDPLTDAKTIFLGAESIFEDETGVLTVTNNGEIFRSENGAWRKLIALDQNVGGARIVRAKALAVNRAGQMIFECITTANDRRVFRFVSAQLTELLRQGSYLPVWGGDVLNWTQASLDDGGRLMMRFDVPGGKPGYYFHNGSIWSASVVENQTQVDGQRVVELFHLQALRNKFYARFVLTAPFRNAAVMESSDGQNWKVRAKTGDVLPVGPKLAFIHDFDANTNGELLISGTVEFSGIPILLSQKGAQLEYVHMLSQPITDSTYLVRYDSIDIREDGSIIFSAYDASDRPVIYRLRRN